MLLKIFWVVTRRGFLVYDQRFGITCLSHLQGLRNLKLGQTSDPESLHHETMPGNNPEDFKQQFISNLPHFQEHMTHPGI
jgi:hypothetical protein